MQQRRKRTQVHFAPPAIFQSISGEILAVTESAALEPTILCMSGIMRSSNSRGTGKRCFGDLRVYGDFSFHPMFIALRRQ
jgi:hypothetical protein